MKTHKALTPILVIVLAAAAGQAVAVGNDSESTSADNNFRGPQPLSDLEARGGARRADGPMTSSGKQLTRTWDERTTCVTTSDGSGQCAPTGRLHEGLGLGITACTDDLDDGEFRVTGALPRGASNASATAGDGRARRMPIVNGVATLELPTTAANAGTLRVEWLVAGKTQTHDLPMPPALARGCG